MNDTRKSFLFLLQNLIFFKNGDLLSPSGALVNETFVTEGFIKH